MYVEQKWRTNKEKNEFARSCPALLGSVADAQGKTVDRILPLGKEGGSVILFKGGYFLIGSFGPVLPPELLETLSIVRSEIEPQYPDFYRELDRLTAEDQELSRLAKLENILGSIRHNAKNMPELADALRNVLSEIEKGAVSQACATLEPPSSEPAGDPGKQEKKE